MSIDRNPLLSCSNLERANFIIRANAEPNAQVIVAALFATNCLNYAYHSFDSCVQAFKDNALHADGARFQFGGLWFIENWSTQTGEPCGTFISRVTLPAGHHLNNA